MEKQPKGQLIFIPKERIKAIEWPTEPSNEDDSKECENSQMDKIQAKELNFTITETGGKQKYRIIKKRKMPRKTKKGYKRMSSEWRIELSPLTGKEGNKIASCSITSITITPAKRPKNKWERKALHFLEKEISFNKELFGLFFDNK